MGPPSKTKDLFSLLTGVQQGSRLVSTINPLLWCQEGTWQRCRVLSACCPTLLPSGRPGRDWTTSLTLCMQRELLFTGMWGKEWRKVSFLKQGRILLLLKKTMKKLVLILLIQRTEMLLRNIKCNSTVCKNIFSNFKNKCNS